MKKPARQHDAVDVILDQWRRERPDLDPAPMGPIGRLKRCAALLEGRLEAGFASYDLSVWEFLPLESDRAVLDLDGELRDHDPQAQAPGDAGLDRAPGQ